jgi:hypothetical protein
MPISMAQLRAQPPTNKGLWRRWLEQAIGPATAGGVILLSEHATSDGICPLDWTWKLYALASGRTDDGTWQIIADRDLTPEIVELLLHGPRGGMKTMGIAVVVHSLCIFNDNYPACHAAASRDQAKAVIGYLKGWARHDNFAQDFAKEPTTEKAEYKNGSVIFLITGSEKGFNSPHTLWFSCDEVELVDIEVLLEGKRIPMRIAGRSLPAVTVLASTQKRRGMTMTTLIEQAMLGKCQYIRWDCFDVAQTCPTWRRENLPEGLSCTDYTDLVEGIKEFGDSDGALEQRLVDKMREQLTALEENCLLVKYCRGRAMSSTGHMAIADIIKALDDSVEQFEAQLMSEKPSSKGAVYANFGRDNVSEEAIWTPGARVIGTADWGFETDPAVANFIALRGPFVDVFAEVHQENMHSDEQAALYAKLSEKYGVEAWAVDASARELISYMRRRHKLTVMAVKRDIGHGIALVARWVLDAKGHRSLRIHPSCVYTIRELNAYEKYENSGKPKAAQQDHHCDSLRYGAEMIGKRTQYLGGRIRQARAIGRTPGSRPKYERD